jgi:hypothetical protein
MVKSDVKNHLEEKSIRYWCRGLAPMDFFSVERRAAKTDEIIVNNKEMDLMSSDWCSNIILTIKEHS